MHEFSLLIFLEYGPIQIKIEDEVLGEQYHANDCMIKSGSGGSAGSGAASGGGSGNIYCKKETPEQDESSSNIRMPEPMLPESAGHLSPSNVNIPMLSPRSDDNYQIPSPCQIEYIENARSPIYLPPGQNTYSSGGGAGGKQQRENSFMGEVESRNNSSMYHMHPPELVRNNSFGGSVSSNRLNHDYNQPQAHLFDNIKTEMRDDTRGE